MNKLILVDAHAYLHRAYHALPPLTTSKGESVNALYGFARTLLKILREHQPDYFAVCFDMPGPTFREKIYPQYKATRKEIDQELRSQFPLSHELVQLLGIAQFQKEGFEADDLIATLAKNGERNGFETVVVSGDKDMFQIVNEKIKVLNESKQILYDSQKVKERWGVAPEEIVDLFALMGDLSDNVPGVPGIGEKTAAKLIQDYGSVEKLLENSERLPEKLKEKMIQYKEQIIQNKNLVTLDRHVPIQIHWEDCRVKLLEQNELVPFLKRFEFHSLVTELFSNRVFSTSKKEIEKYEENYETILTQEQLILLVSRLSSSERFAVDLETTGLDVRKSELVGIALSWKKGFAAYIPLKHRYLGAAEQLPVEEVLRWLKPLLENKTIKKIGQNLKFDFSFLVQAGIRMQNLYFDTMVASYCLNPSRSSHGLKDLVLEFLGRNMTRIEELISPKSRSSNSKEFPMDQVEIEKAASYACADADCTLQLSDRLAILLKEKGCESLFYDVEMALVEILADMGMRGIKVNTSHLGDLEKKFSKEICELELKAYHVTGQEFNLNSSKQLAFILFEKLKLPSSKKTKTGFSTDEEVLTFLSPMHELPRILLKHRELSKLKSTYIDGLLLLVEHKTSRVHTSFSQTTTATGRLSSRDPNLQNIPIRTEYGRMIRRAFIPENGNLFLSADYSQIDLRVLAHLSQDKTLCQAFHSGEDIHRSTAAEVFHLPLGAVTEEQRTRAKAINFGIVYGQQSFGLSQSLGVSLSEAQAMIEKYFQNYPGVKEWIEKTKQEAKQNGYVKTLLGRVRYLPEIHSKNGSVRSFAERIAVNTPVQGTSADIIKIAMIKIGEKLEKAQLLVQVHDDLLFEVPKGQARETAKIVKKEMENAVELSVPVLADLKMGENWADMAPLNLIK